LGERVEDLFYITYQQGKPVHDESLAETLISRIENELDSFVQKEFDAVRVSNKTRNTN
jgi:UTP:GlnB (protein PII) uridylyltransferase